MSAGDTAQVVSAVAGCASAVGTVAAATAAWRAALQANRSAERSNIAFARSTRPSLVALLANTELAEVSDPATVTVLVTNGPEFPARNVRAEITKLYGPEPRMSFSSAPIAVLAPGATERVTMSGILEPFGSGIPPNGQQTVWKVTLIFQDDTEMITWRRMAGGVDSRYGQVQANALPRHILTFAPDYQSPPLEVLTTDPGASRV